MRHSSHLVLQARDQNLQEAVIRQTSLLLVRIVLSELGQLQCLSAVGCLARVVPLVVHQKRNLTPAVCEKQKISSYFVTDSWMYDSDGIRTINERREYRTKITHEHL